MNNEAGSATTKVRVGASMDPSVDEVFDHIERRARCAGRIQRADNARLWFMTTGFLLGSLVGAASSSFFQPASTGIVVALAVLTAGSALLTRVMG